MVDSGMKQFQMEAKAKEINVFHTHAASLRAR